jgi:hypothetical protein
LEKVSPSKILYNKSANSFNSALNNIEAKELNYSQILKIRDDFIENA